MPAPAYIDAGTGTMIFQMLIAGLMAGAFYIGSGWQRIKDFFARCFGKGDGATSGNDD
jgi:hypothetical protein